MSWWYLLKPSSGGKYVAAIKWPDDLRGLSSRLGRIVRRDGWLMQYARDLAKEIVAKRSYDEQEE